MENISENNRIKSNDKRLQSIKSLKQTYQKQKSIIQSALSNIDKRSNKIIFDEDLEESSNNVKAKRTKSGKDLFDDESDDNFEVDFSLKKQFDGEKGQKLLELQSKFKNDKRFALSEKFLGDDTVNDTLTENGVNHGEEISLEKEKEREFEILNQVLQKHQIKPKLIKEKNVESEKKFMVRFDPSHPQHSKYEIKKEEIKKRKKDKTKGVQELLGTKKSDETEEPEVSKTVFYQVKGNLKDTLHTNNQVSLLSMFGNANENGSENMEEEQEEKEIRISKPKITNEKNPFKYDSSDDEDETNFSKQAINKTNGISEHKEAPINRTNFWVETFFFKEDDYRLQEGFDFVEKMKVEDTSEFSRSRRELKEIVKTKIRNVQQKKKLFKTKLGGSKRRQKDKRMKKALKK